MNEHKPRRKNVKVNKATMVSMGLMAAVSLAAIWAANNVDAVNSLTQKKGWF